MKKIITKDELYSKMDEAVNLLCDTVKTTLGPRGSNAIIDHSDLSPFITNDGVTIAQNITSEDAVTNTILELTKEAAIQTDTQVGDGTTTTLVLLQSIYNSARTLVQEGVNPLILKKELDASLPPLITAIHSYSRKPSSQELHNIATISGNSKEIGDIIYQAFQKTPTKNAIRLNESESPETTITYQNGYIIEALLPSPYLLSKELTLKNPQVLITTSYLNNLDVYADLLNAVIATKSSLIIFAPDFDEYLTNQVISINEQEHTNIILLKIPGYGQNKLAIQNDLALLSNSTILNTENITKENLGHFTSVTINHQQVTISIPQNKTIDNYRRTIQDELANSENTLVQEQNAERLAMFTTGLIDINIGALTKTERIEKKMRFTDALWAVDSASRGIIPGSGIILAKIGSSLNNERANKIFSKALQGPLKQILTNAGLDATLIISDLQKSQYQKLYNISTNEYEELLSTAVVDPTAVVINALQNATSIATMLITTSSLIINESPKLENPSGFNEL